MKIKEIFSKYKRSLFTVNSEPLTKMSKLFLLIFVAFSLYIIFLSVQQQKRIIDRPSERFGWGCINLVQKDVSKIDIYDFRYSYDNFGTNKECQTLNKLYNKNTVAFEKTLNKISTLKRQIYNKERMIKQLQKQYSNMLLEKIANQSKQKSILAGSSDNVKAKIVSNKEEIAKIRQQIKKLENIHDEAEYKEFINFLKQKAEIINNNYESYRRYYALKVLFSIYMFLIPLFVVVFFLYNFAVKREKYILSHLLVNLLNVVGLFILFYLLSFIFDIIPHVFFEKLFILIQKLNLIAFANYIAIAFFVLVFGLVIKFIQNRALKQRELKNKQLANNYIKMGKCHKCGANKSSEYSFCPNCGANLYEICKSCNSKRISNSKFCQECGKE